MAPAPEFIGKSGGVDVAGKDLKGQADPERYPDWLFQGDAMLGEIMRVLERRGLADNTLLIATSDNGAEQRAYAPLRESKRSIYEGGHRVPFVARWPGKVQPGTTWNHPVCLNDLMATAADITGAKLPPNAGEDSVSLLPALLGKSDAPTREATIHQSMGGDLAIRQGPWKLIFTKSGSRELYNLESDLSETKDVLAANPEVVAKLTALMQRYIDNGRSTAGAAQKNDFDLSLTSARAKGKRNNKGQRRKPKQDKDAETAKAEEHRPSLGRIEHASLRFIYERAGISSGRSRLLASTPQPDSRCRRRTSRTPQRSPDSELCRTPPTVLREEAIQLRWHPRRTCAAEGSRLDAPSMYGPASMAIQLSCSRRGSPPWPRASAASIRRSSGIGSDVSRSKTAMLSAKS